MLKAENSSTRTFAEAEEGTVAMIFAICCFVVFMVVGLAIDLGRVMHAGTKITSSADAAALAAAKAMREGTVSDAEAHAVAMNYFNKNLEGGGASYARINAVDIQIDRLTNAVKIDVDADVRTTFGQIAGLQKISVPATSTAIYDSKDIELGLQLAQNGNLCRHGG